MFYPRVGCISYVFINAKNMEQLCPEPLGGINSSHILQIIDRKFFCRCIDFSGLIYTGMILPQYEHCVGVFFKPGNQCKWSSCLINCNRSGTSGVNRNGLYVRRNCWSGLEKAAL